MDKIRARAKPSAIKNRLLRETFALIKKEFLLEWRERYALNGLALYIFTSAFVLALSLKGKAEPPVWNVTFWVVNLYAAMNAVGRSFISETEGQALYMFQLASPISIIAARAIYNCVVMAGALVLTSGAFLVLLGNPFYAFSYFLFALLLAAPALALGLTLISAIAAQGRNKTALMAVLGFPVLIPQLLALIRLTDGAMRDVFREKEALFLISLIVIVTILSFILFPYIWKD